MKGSVGFWCISISLLSFLASGNLFSSEPIQSQQNISYHVAGSYYPEHKHLLIPAFKEAVNSWLHRYDPKLLTEDESSVRMQTSYKGLYEIQLTMHSDGYIISAHLAKRVMREGRAKHVAEHLVFGLVERVEAVLREPKREREARYASEQKALEVKEREEARRAQEAAAIAEDSATIGELNSLGHLRGYPKLASYRYAKCERLANIYLNADLKTFREQFESGLASVTTCSKKEESALSVEVRLALKTARGEISNQLKDLHAYTVASLRALANFHQSAIEARRARAERSAGIDERTTRLELEL